MGLANARERVFLIRMGLCKALQAKGRGHSRCAGELQGLSNSRVRDFQELQSCSEGFAGEKGDSQKLSGVFLEPSWAKGEAHRSLRRCPQDLPRKGGVLSGICTAGHGDSHGQERDPCRLSGVLSGLRRGRGCLSVVCMAFPWLGNM